MSCCAFHSYVTLLEEIGTRHPAALPPAVAVPGLAPPPFAEDPRPLWPLSIHLGLDIEPLSSLNVLRK